MFFRRGFMQSSVETSRSNIYYYNTFQSALPLQTNQLSLVQCVYTIEQLAKIIFELLHKIYINVKILEFNLPH